MRRDWAIVLCLLFFPATASAQAPVSPLVVPEPWPGAVAARHDPFRAGACSLQVMAGYFPMTSLGPGGPDFDYLPLSVRAGVVVKEPDQGRPWLPGAVELLLDYTYSPIVTNVGSYFTGPSLVLRYTAVDPSRQWQPYAQLGAGFVFTDAHRAPVHQDLIGQSFEFLLRAEVGVRFFLSERLSLDIEGGLQHISNAGLARRNGGINNVGAAIGLTYSFGSPW